MRITTKTVKASTVRGYTLGSRIKWRGFWIFRTGREVLELIEHRRTTYALTPAFDLVSTAEIITVNESAVIEVFDPGSAAQAIHILAAHNERLAHNEFYSNYQHT